MENNFYIYRHIRPDKNEVFYIGKGMEGTRRHISKDDRNNYWHNIVNKNGGQYDIEIMIDGLTEKEAFEKEIEFIQIYGRSVDGGTLCNITKGGEGIFGHKHSDKTKEKISKATLGKVVSDGTKEKISLSKKGVSINNGTPRIDVQEKAWEAISKKVICTNSGVIYKSIKNASDSLGVSCNKLRMKLRGVIKNNTTLRYYENKNRT